VYGGTDHAIVVPALPNKFVIAAREFDAENAEGLMGCLLLDVVNPAAGFAKL